MVIHARYLHIREYTFSYGVGGAIICLYVCIVTYFPKGWHA